MSALHDHDLEWRELIEECMPSTNVGFKAWLAVVLGIVSCLSYGCIIDFTPENSNNNDVEDAGVTADSAVNPQGSFGGPCYPDDTCDHGLVCDDGVCMAHCGDEIIAGDEECDNGDLNGIECTTSPGTVCEYCTEDCRLAYKSDYPFLVVYRADKPPVVDGETNEFCRADSVTIHMDETGSQGTYSFLWDDNAIYIAADVLDDELNGVASERDGDLWKDDSIEVFFDPLLNGGSELQFDDYQFIVNILRHRFDALGDDKLWDMDPDFPFEVILNGIPNNNQSDFGYSIEFALPWSDWLGDPPTEGSTMGFDVVLNDRRNDGSRFHKAWANQGTRWLIPDNWGRIYFSSTTVRTDCND